MPENHAITAILFNSMGACKHLRARPQKCRKRLKFRRQRFDVRNLPQTSAQSQRYAGSQGDSNKLKNHGNHGTLAKLTTLTIFSAPFMIPTIPTHIRRGFNGDKNGAALEKQKSNFPSKPSIPW